MQTLLTRALPACGAVAGPMYVTVTMAQALTRDGFDLRQHRFSWLTAGDFGWIQKSNMVLVGVLAVLFCGRRAPSAGKGSACGVAVGATAARAVWGGLRHRWSLASGPSGRLPVRHHTGNGAHHLGGSRPECLTWGQHSLPYGSEPGDRDVVCSRGAPGLAGPGFYGAGFFVVLSVLTAVGFGAICDYSAFALAILATPWILVTALARHMYQCEAKRRNDTPTGLGTRTRPVPGHAAQSS
jgi:hypothetical protein